MKFLQLAVLLLGLAAPARAVEYTTNYYQIKYSTPSGIATENLSGRFKVAASSKTASTFTITLDGLLGQGFFGGVGNSTFSVVASSGIYSGSGIYATFMRATSFIGDLIGTAISIAGGAAGNILYQSGSGVTAFIPAISSPGSIFGNGAAAPSTGTYSAAFSLANTGSGLTLSVDSSSVAVKNGGFVRNSEIDGSSVTKLNASGLVPNSLIDGSSITKQGVGISSSCTSGQYLQAMTTTGGVIKGGSCATAGAGDVSSSASNSFNTAATNQTFGSSVTFNGGIFGVIDRSTWTYLPGGVQSTNAFGACITSTITMTTDGVTPLVIWLDGSFSENSTQECGINVLMDGAFISPFSATVAMKTLTPISTTCHPVRFEKIVAPPSAASHSFCVTTACNSSINFTIIGRSTVCPYQSLRGEGTQFGVGQIHTNQ